LVEDLANREDPVGKWFLKLGLRSCAVVPLMNEERVIGTLSVGSTRCGAYAERHVPILEGIAGHLSVAVTNARLYESVSRRTLELEVLARETQHRVQNNLQMIAGLVSMMGTDTEVPPKSVSRCLSQIQAISVIHEMLSCEQDIGEVGLKDSVDRIAKMAVFTLV
jgi:transcriptional regulator with GAF, ATPase, and Fis domain